jgi:glycosyltransferase involved in cell wall biosynthesis
MPHPIKIVHVVHSLNVGGLENGLVNLLNNLDEQFSHTILCLSQSGPMAQRIKNRDVAIIEMGLPTDRFRFPLVRLARLFRQISPDIVHSRGWSSIDAISAARMASVPHVIHAEHGWEATDPKGQNFKRKVVRKCLSPLVDRFVTVSEDLKRWLTQSVGIAERKVTCIHNGVDTQRFAPLGAQSAGRAQSAERMGHRAKGEGQQAAGGGQRAVGERTTASRLLTTALCGHPRSGASSVVRSPQSALSALRHRLGLPVEGVLFGTVGRLDPVKDHRSLLKAFAPMARSDRPAYLLIAGGGPMQTEIAILVAQLGMGDEVLLLGERGDVPEILQALDVFALPSIAEGISNTILEAMASGLPVVATQVGGNPELVEDGVTGQLVPVRDAMALTIAFESYLRDPQLRQEHGRNGRLRAEQCFSLDRMAARYATLYERVALGA